MTKYKFFLDFEKEEKWLNQMAREGWELIRKFIGYDFRKATPNDTIIKIDYRSFKTRAAFEDYCTLFSDSGWEHIAGTKYSGTQYFKKTVQAVDEDIFSDAPSKAARYKKISNLWLTFAVTYIPLFVALLTTNTVDITALLNPKLLYYTPGLWERTGIPFWGGLLFETPFVIMRSFSVFFFPVAIILYLIFAIKSAKNYQRVKNG